MTSALLVLFLAASAPAQERETVVILHGMARGRVSMKLLEHRFRAAGFETLNFPYSQREGTLDEISAKLADYLEKNVKTPRYHLVGHSLGGIVIRNAFKRPLRPGLGRVVMLAPPNRPAVLAKMFKANRLYRWVTGEPGQKLADDDFYNGLPEPKVEFAVIAGDAGQTLTFKEPNDGIVDVEGTKLPGMKAFAVVHHVHALLMNGADTFRLARRFVEAGTFEPEPSLAGARAR